MLRASFLAVMLMTFLDPSPCFEILEGADAAGAVPLEECHARLL